MRPTTTAAGFLVLALSLAAWPAAAQDWEDAPLIEELPEGLGEAPTLDDPEGGSDDESVLVAEFGLDERNVVLSAVKSRATIQEVPAIVTVITADEIKVRGYRTINDLLQTVPGFEADRWEFNGWTQEPLARGNPRTVLILLNGVNIVDPSRNQTTLDRKIPMEAVKRVEIVSGPGGVLWGSNALLGVVNIITKDADDLDGAEITVGAGGGPGEQWAAKTNFAYGGKFLDGKLRMFSNLSLFTSLGPELTVDNQKVVGILPAPADDGTQLYIAESATTSDPTREYHFNFIGQLGYGDLTLEWMIPWERDARQVAGSGALLTDDLRTDRSQVAFDTEGVAQDPISVVALAYKTRLFADTFGISAKAYFVHLKILEDPLGVFPPSNVSPRTETGVFTRLESENGAIRYGLNLDMDLKLTATQKLVFGAEVFQENLPTGAQTTGPIADAAIESLTPEQQAEVFEQNGVKFFTEDLFLPVKRTIGALYLVDEFQLSSAVALSAGARLQLSDRYDPTSLLSGAMVWNVAGDTYLKLNYAEGFRPPEFQSTDINGEAVNQITFQPNDNLDVERSRSTEVELNTVVLKGGNFINRLYLRADYSVSLLEDIIVNERGNFRNSGTRLIHSTEALARLELRGGHEIWGAYYFVDVDDSELGKLRQIANHVVNVGGRAYVLPRKWEVSALLTWIGPREDRNRFVDPTRDKLFGLTPVRPTDVFIEELDPVYLLRVGTRVVDIYDLVTISLYGYNVLNQTWHDPDLFFDDGSLTRPYPKPRWSVFGQAEVKF